MLKADYLCYFSLADCCGDLPTHTTEDMALFQSACRKEYLFQINRASGWLRSFGIGAIERSSTRKLFRVQPDRDGDQDKEWICGCLLSVSTLWIPKQCKFWLNKIILLSDCRKIFFKNENKIILKKAFLITEEYWLPIWSIIWWW